MRAVLLASAVALLAGPSLAKPPSENAMQRMLFVAPDGKPFRGQPGQPYPSAAWFAGADADHDGKLTKAEYKADFIAYFDTLDTDHDGEIAPPEIERYETDILPETRMGGGGFAGYAYSQAGGGGDDSGGDAPKAPPLRPSGASFFNFLGSHEPLLPMDTNFNRGISRAEYAAGADRTWKLLNPKGKPWITMDDLPKTMAQR